MKCPVCKTECNGYDSCPNCGFTEIRTEFLNKDEAQRWMDDTVIPCQAVYKKMSQKLQEIEKANQNVDSSNKKSPRKSKKTTLKKFLLNHFHIYDIKFLTKVKASKIIPILEKILLSRLEKVILKAI